MCTDKLSDRSYIVESNDNRRNREHLIQPEQAKDIQPEPVPTASKPALSRSQRVIKKPDRFI